jgi:hypothetical protein
VGKVSSTGNEFLPFSNYMIENRVERLLNAGGTRDGERDPTQLLAVIIWMMVVICSQQGAST